MLVKPPSQLSDSPSHTPPSGNSSDESLTEPNILTESVTQSETEMVKPKNDVQLASSCPPINLSSTTLPTEIPSNLSVKMHEWSTEDLAFWFGTLKLSRDYSTSLKENGVDGDAFVNDFTTKDDLKCIGIVIGDAGKILRAKQIVLNKGSSVHQ